MTGPAVPITPVLVGDFEGDKNPLTTDGARDAFIKVNDNTAALDALNVERRVYWVYGDSTDGGTTPDTTTQASIDALVAAGIPEANIRWLYEVPSANVFVIGPLTSAVTIDNVVLVIESGEFVVADMTSSVTADNITISETGGGTFIIQEVTSATTIDNITITEDIDLLTSLRSWWTLNETSSTRADSHGTIDLSDINTVGNAVGKQGNCADFEYDNLEHLLNTSASNLNFASTDFTVAFWFNTESAPQHGRIIDITTSSNAAVLTIGTTQDSDPTYGSNSLFATWRNTSDSSFVVRDATNTSYGTWGFGLFEYDLSADKIYITLNNGTRNEFATTGTIKVTVGKIAIGALASSASSNFDGKVDEVGVWHKLLTSNEKAALYNSGSGIGYPG